MKLNRKIYSLIGPALLITLWSGFSRHGLIHPLFLPHPFEVFFALVEYLSDTVAWKDVYMTTSRALWGLILGSVLGIPIGLLAGYFINFYRSIEFIVDFCRSIPSASFFPLFMLFFGINDVLKVALVSFVVLFPIIIHTLYGVRFGVQARYLVAKTLRFKGLPLFYKFILPEALPQIFSGLKVALSRALVVVVVVEMLLGSKLGLGRRITDFQLSYKIPEMYAVIILLGIIGYSLNGFFNFFQRKIVHWNSI